MTESDQYFRCGGCGRFVAWSSMERHYTSGHKEGIAVEQPPAPATVANPPPMPSFAGVPTPPIVKTPLSGSIAIDILLMKRSHNKAFWVWTAVVVALTAMAVSSLFLDIILFKL